MFLPVDVVGFVEQETLFVRRYLFMFGVDECIMSDVDCKMLYVFLVTSNGDKICNKVFVVLWCLDFILGFFFSCECYCLCILFWFSNGYVLVIICWWLISVISCCCFLALFLVFHCLVDHGFCLLQLLLVLGFVSLGCHCLLVFGIVLLQKHWDSCVIGFGLLLIVILQRLIVVDTHDSSPKNTMYISWYVLMSHLYLICLCAGTVWYIIVSYRGSPTQRTTC